MSWFPVTTSCYQTGCQIYPPTCIGSDPKPQVQQRWTQKTSNIIIGMWHYIIPDHDTQLAWYYIVESLVPFIRWVACGWMVRWVSLLCQIALITEHMTALYIIIRHWVELAKLSVTGKPLDPTSLYLLKLLMSCLYNSYSHDASNEPALHIASAYLAGIPSVQKLVKSHESCVHAYSRHEHAVQELNSWQQTYPCLYWYACPHGLL